MGDPARRIPVLVVAGEPSGDRLAAAVVAELRARRPELCFFGAGGPALAGQGVELRHEVDRLAVAGLTEVSGRLGAAIRAWIDLWWQSHRRRPAFALLVDYPGLNLRLARSLRRGGIPVLYYVAPQRWAWMARRAAAIARAVDRLAVVLPFEERWFAAHGVDARFVGHPLLDLFQVVPRAQARARLGLGAGERVVALLPGSRSDEVRRHLPLFCAALAGEHRDARAVLAVLPGRHAALCRRLAPHVPCADTATVLGAADAALCASGSATLELALAEVPAVVCYRSSWLTAAVARQLLTVPMLALPNLILGRRLLPELLQDQLTPAALSSALRAISDPATAQRIRAGLREVRGALGAPGAAARVAELASSLLPAADRQR